MITRPYLSRLGGIGALAITICIASCSSNSAQPPQLDMSKMQLAPAPAGSCQIDAVKMCQVTDGSQATAPPHTAPMPSSYGPPNVPDSLEFQIPAGQSITLSCFYDPQHSLLYRAEATAESPLTGNSVEYMKQHGFCANK